MLVCLPMRLIASLEKFWKYTVSKLKSYEGAPLQQNITHITQQKTVFTIFLNAIQNYGFDL